MTVLAEVARQVDAWHEHAAARGGLDSAHGDLKPTNVLLGTTGRWLISDFGAPPVDPPKDSPWAESDVVPGGGAFLAPELRFHARIDLPKAVDVWSLGAIAFAMLRMRRVVLDGSALPRNGTASLRFGPARAEQIAEVYRSSPAQFFEKELQPAAFPTPEHLPQPDRTAIRESLRGALGEEDEGLEAELTNDVLKVLDRALAIAPERRYADAATLANALDDLARKWISLAARKDEQENPAAVPGPVIEALIRERDVARARAAAVQSEMSSLQDRIDALQDALTDSQLPPPPPKTHVAAAPSGPDRTPLLLAGMGAIVLLQFGTLAGIAALLVAVIVG
ncbi:MAG: serine/threonine protein kinase [Myxococcota bacterium]|jgi:serine/threonine protein kinase